jgi:signal peptidase I
MTKRGVKRYIWGGIGLLLTIAAWVLFAPTQLGGAVAYTVISGSSMEPHLHEGDLAITREQDSYGPGDVVAYHNSELDSVVLHRVVRIEDGRLVVKGDNNDFFDADKPLPSNVIGEQWIRIPGAGGFVQKIREPRVAATIVALLSAMALGLFSFTRSRRPRSGSSEKSEGLGATFGSMLPSGAAAEKTFAGLALAAACLVALAVFAYTRPTNKTVVDKIGFEHSGTFAYSADAPKGPVYADGRVDTGDPVFLRVVDNIRVTFDYQFASQAPHSVSGDGRLVAVLSDTNGWSRTFVIDGGDAVEDGHLELAGDLDLAQMRVLAQQIEKLTGITRDAYTLTVTPEISVEGTLAGRPLVESFTSPTTFQLDALQLRYGSEGGDGEPLRPTSEGFVNVLHSAPATVGVMGADLSVSALRRVGVAGALLALAALALVARPLWSRERDEVARILARYASRLVPVARMPRPLEEAIEVTDMDTLVRLAEGYERAILHVVDGRQHSFIVEHAGTTYVFTAHAQTSLAGVVAPRGVGFEPHNRTPEAYSATENGPGGPRSPELS